MKAARILLLILFFSALICFVRGDLTFPIVQTLPFAGGPRPGKYEIAAFILILLLLWGLARLKRLHNESED